MTNDYSEEGALLAGFKNRESPAELKVFQNFFKPLCLYSEQITGSLQQSEDIVAEAFEKCWDRRDEFQTMENLKRFLYRVVRNASINFNLADQRRQTHQEQMRYLSMEDENMDELLTNEVLRAELLQEIYKEIENLPEKCRAIFKLLFIRGWTTNQIAKHLSINTQTVRSQKARAIQLIKTELLRNNRMQALLLLSMLLREVHQTA